MSSGSGTYIAPADRYPKAMARGYLLLVYFMVGALAVQLPAVLGLLGTVLGVMDAFLGIASGGSGNISAVAPGVAEALITTVLGLAVAIPAVIAYNILANRLGVFAGELEGFAQEIIGAMAREGRV